MEHFIKSVFKLISQLKNIDKSPLIIDEEDMLVIYNYYRSYKLYKKVRFKTFKQAVANYCVINAFPVHKSCEEICKKLKFN